MNNIDSAPLYLGLDLGTSAFKAALVNADGGTVATFETAVENIRSEGGRVEIDPEQYCETMYRCIRGVCGGFGGRVVSVTLSGAAGSSLAVGSDGRAGRIISWLDRRCGEVVPTPLEGLTPEAVRAVTGWPCVTSFPLAQLAWMRQHEPERLDGALWLGLCTDWLQACLCGRHCLDFSTGTTLHLIEQSERRYHTDYLRRLGIRENQLSRLVDSGTTVGALTHEAAARSGLREGTAVVAGAFDHPSAASGCGVREEGQLLLSCGTSWVAFFPVRTREWIVSRRLLCDPFESASGGCWGAMFSIESLGGKVERYVREQIAPGTTAPFQRFNQLAAECRTDERVDMREPCHPVSLPPPRLARAVMNGTAALFAEALRTLVPPVPFKCAVLAGGPAKSPVWPDIIRAYTGLDITVTDSFTGARGAAALGRRGITRL